MTRARKYDLLFVPLYEGVLILILAAIGWAVSWPLVFASLGPTAYEIVEKPRSKSAKTWNVIAGHFVAIGAGFFAVWVVDAWNSPKVMASGFVAAPRMWAAVIAVAVTALITLAIEASQPAAMSTALLVSLGPMQTALGAVSIIVAVLILAALGAPLRRHRAKEASEGRAAAG